MASADASATPGLIDIRRPPVPGGVRRFMWRLPRLFLIALGAVVLIAVLVLGVALLAKRLLWPGTGPVVVYVVALGAAVLIHIRRRRGGAVQRRRLMERIDSGVDMGAAIAESVKADPQHLAWLASPRTGRALLSHGGAGLTIRVDENTTSVRPFMQPFEARLLADGESDFEELAEAGDAMVAPLPASVPTSTSAKAASSPAWAWSKLTVTAVVPPVLLAVMVVVPVILLWRQYGSWGRLFAAAPPKIAMVVSWMVVLVLWKFLVARRTQWLVVPCGIILRDVPLYGGVKLRLLDRRTSLLMVVASDSSLLMPQVTVVNEHDAAARRVTDKELEMLLRAWLSPLAPPAVETLSDLQ